MRRGLKIFDSVEVVYRCFNSFMLPVLVYASVVWGSAAHTHLALLDRIVGRCAYLMNDVVPCNLSNRRSVAAFVCCIRFVSVSVIRFLLAFRILIGVSDLFDVLKLSMNLLLSLFVLEQISILGRSSLHLLTSGIA